MAKTERYVVKGLDAWGNSVEDDLAFKRLNWFERAMQTVKRAVRRPRVCSGIRVEAERLKE